MASLLAAQCSTHCFGEAPPELPFLLSRKSASKQILRFMSKIKPAKKWKWWFAVLAAGPGWVVLGAKKQLMALCCHLLLQRTEPPFANANEPIHMYITGFGYAFPASALILAAIFIFTSQIKINVTDAYSGSLSWSNFFSCLTHRHPRRVIYIFLNVGIVLALMEGNMFSVLGTILEFYSNVAVAWIGAIVADLVINKPLLKLSPSYIEFKRARLYNFNPIGFGAMLIASIVSVATFFGAFGPWSDVDANPILTIRRIFFREHLSISAIERRTSLSRNTVKKWLWGAGRYRATYCSPRHRQADTIARRSEPQQRSSGPDHVAPTVVGTSRGWSRRESGLGPS